MSPTCPNSWTISAIAQEMLSRSVAAVFAFAANFDDRPRRGEAGVLRRFAHSARQIVIVEVNGLAAGVADQEDAVVKTAGMLVRDIGIRALDAAREVGGHEQVEDAVDAVGGDAASLGARNRFRDVIGACRLLEIRERI